MKMVITLQVASAMLTPQEIEAHLGYKADNLTVIGCARIPPRSLPDKNLWNGGLIIENENDLEFGLSKCLDKYPEIGKKISQLREKKFDIDCTVSFGLSSLSTDFIIFFSREIIEKIAQIGCEVSVEYFAD